MFEDSESLRKLREEDRRFVEELTRIQAEEDESFRELMRPVQMEERKKWAEFDAVVKALEKTDTRPESSSS